MHLFEIIPDYDLDIMIPGQTLIKYYCRIFEEIKLVFLSFKSDAVLVHGDIVTMKATT